MHTFQKRVILPYRTYNLRPTFHLFPRRNIFLVTEFKSEGGIGIFSGEDLAFGAGKKMSQECTHSKPPQCRCSYPPIYGVEQKESFTFPTNILCTKSGFVFIVERDQILILNQELKLAQQPIKGQYAGLAEEEDGSVGTIQVQTSAAFSKPSIAAKDINGVLKLKRIEFNDSPREVR